MQQVITPGNISSRAHLARARPELVASARHLDFHVTQSARALLAYSIHRVDLAGVSEFLRHYQRLRHRRKPKSHENLIPPTYPLPTRGLNGNTRVDRNMVGFQRRHSGHYFSQSALQWPN